MRAVGGTVGWRRWSPAGGRAAPRHGQHRPPRMAGTTDAARVSVPPPPTAGPPCARPRTTSCQTPMPPGGSHVCREDRRPEDHMRRRERSARVLARIGRDGRRPAAEVVGQRRFLFRDKTPPEENTCWLPVTLRWIWFELCAPWSRSFGATAPTPRIRSSARRAASCSTSPKRAPPWPRSEALLRHVARQRRRDPRRARPGGRVGLAGRQRVGARAVRLRTAPVVGPPRRGRSKKVPDLGKDWPLRLPIRIVLDVAIAD